MRKDTWTSANKSEIIFYQPDGALGDNFENLPFGKLLGPLAVHLRSQEITFTILAKPFSLLTGEKAWGNPLSCNRSAVLYYLLKRLKMTKTAHKFMSRRVGLFLSKSNARAIFTIGADDWLCEACHMYGIPIVEVLHGKGYTYIPWGWEKKNVRNLPSQIICFDLTSTKTFQALSSKGLTITQSQEIWSDFFDQTISLQNTNQVWDAVILFSMQWGYNGDHGSKKYLKGILDNGIAPEFILEMVKNRNLNYKWLFRLHPNQLRGSQFKRLAKTLNKLKSINPYFEWETTSKNPLSTILGGVTHHITMYSMTTYDAAERGIPTLLLCPTLQPGGVEENLYKDLISANLAIKGLWEQDYVNDWILQYKGKEFTENCGPEADLLQIFQDFL
jgi:hypothetical protein